MNNPTRVIFVDSTVSHKELLEYTTSRDLLLPGIRRGDLIRAVGLHPNLKSIVIIDGVFEEQASITHKEILWALAKGLKVVGLASLGALRAYELMRFGMKGYGKIFRQYEEGDLDGDDEVSIVYFPGLQNSTKTIPMINIRATLRRLSIEENNELITSIRSIHFRKRTWLEISKKVSKVIHESLMKNYIDLKREDVISFFKSSPEHREVTDTSNIELNLFFIKNIVKKRYPTITSFLDYCLSIMPRAPKITTKKSLEEYAQNIINYLDLPIGYVDDIAKILSELIGFTFNSERIKKASRMIRKEQKLTRQSDLLNFISRKKIPINSLQGIYEGIVKLEAYFLSQAYVIKSL
ncbi:TfuA-like protein [Legionella sp. PATHC038]|uniref:TfuA-like protein n=1 Tax=Legionella sheltonii TaxID=2992041 RepID=UPI0022442A26|nr:TfuA-like protein [Legionella sp. PATHC038]MCW8400738.1 TfuA-like protein [Legionella sp. PATHC038]